MTSSTRHHLYWLLNAGPAGSSQARELIWEALARLGLDISLIDDAVTITGELAANAIVHGTPPVELQLHLASTEITLLLIDRGPGMPVWTSPGSESLSGRGLLVVSAYSNGNCGTAATTYRSFASLHGKAVWAALPRRPRQLADLQPAAAARLLQRWLARRGLRGVVTQAHGDVWLVSVAAGSVICCLPGKLTWRTGREEQVYAYPELPNLVDHLCARMGAATEADGAA
jgi:anti-sigma regulatory factor (Ser/Thr protein kinase)